MDAEERYWFEERVDDAEAASVGRARAAGGGRIEVTIEELARVLDRPAPTIPPRGDADGR